MHKYIDRLFDEENIDGLKDEEDRTLRVIESYQEELYDVIENPKHQADKIRGILDRERKILEKTRKSIEQLSIKKLNDEL